jgi:hypothetical protein
MRTARSSAGSKKILASAAFGKDKKRWFLFELSSDADLHEALDYLTAAFKAARIPKKTK